MNNLVEGGLIKQLLEPQSGPNSTDLDGEFVKLDKAHNCFIVVNVAEGDAQDYTLTIRETDGSTPQDLDNTVPIWQISDASDVDNELERETDAKEIDITAGTNDLLVVFQIDPAKLDLADDYHSVTLRVTSAGDASNQTVSATAYIQPARYKYPRDDA